MSLQVKKNCPSCKSPTIQILNKTITCRSCDFSCIFQCPICDASLENDMFTSGPDGEYFICSQCKNVIKTKKIKALIEGALVVDHHTRCELCNGPTIHRKDINLGNRCFFFPKCSGQATLFGTKHETLAFLDFETTGLDIGKDSIIEIGALKIDEDGDTQTFQTFVQPAQAVSERITGITGITDEMVQGSPDLKTTMTMLNDFIGTSKIVAHNADFDIPWMVTSCIRHDITIKAKDIICTLKWAKKNEEPRASLGALARKYKISHNNAHRALADAATTKELFFIFENCRKIEKPVIPIKEYYKMCKQIVERYSNYVQP